MATAVTKSEYGHFLEKLAVGRERLLILDYDGTLAPFTEDRFRAYPYPGVRDLLNEIQRRCNTRVVIVTGRPAMDIPALLQLEKKVEVWGVYGMERIHPDGREELAFTPPAGLQALAEADSWLEEFGLGDRIDYKGSAVAVHLRGLSPRQADEIRLECYSKFAQLACAANLNICEFDGGVELRLRGCDKAHAIERLLAECEDDCPVAFLGDDPSDESGFRALAGRGLSALVRPTYRETSAEIWLRPPQQLIKFFEDWLQASERSR